MLNLRSEGQMQPMEPWNLACGLGNFAAPPHCQNSTLHRAGWSWPRNLLPLYGQIRARLYPFSSAWPGWGWLMPPPPMELNLGQVTAPPPEGPSWVQMKASSTVWLDWGWAVPPPCSMQSDRALPDLAHKWIGHCPSSTPTKKFVYH